MRCLWDSSGSQQATFEISTQYRRVPDKHMGHLLHSVRRLSAGHVQDHPLNSYAALLLSCCV